MSHFSKLKSEISNDPLGRGYSTMQTDQDVLTSLTTADITIKEKLSYAALQVWAGNSSRLQKVKTATTSGADDSIKSKASAFLNLIENGDGFDFNDADCVSLIDDVITDGTLSAADKTALETSANKLISRAEQLGIGTVRIGEVTAARS